MPRFLFTIVEKKTESGEKKSGPSPADNLAGLIRRAKGQAEVRQLADRSHFMANHLIGAPEDATGQILLDFVRRVTK
jgi:hypothetical protein